MHSLQDPQRRKINNAMAFAGSLAAMPRISAAKVQRRFLPPPARDGGKPLMQCLDMRRSTRSYSRMELPDKTLSELLWAAYGINRPTGERTAPYWRHVMVIDIYVAMADGTWFYDPALHMLRAHLSDDLRARTGTQDFPATAPVNLIYVANGNRMGDVSEEDRRLYASVDAAFIGQNVYLYCASEGLATVFRGALDVASLGKAMQLEQGQFVTFAQTVGYPQN